MVGKTATIVSPSDERQEHMEELVTRLENVTRRLESVTQTRETAVQTKTPSPKRSDRVNGAPNEPSSPVETSRVPERLETMSVAGYEDLVAGPVNDYLQICNKIGGDVESHGKLVQQAFQLQLQFIKTAASRPEPSDANEKNDLIKPSSKVIEEIQAYRKTKRDSQFFNHLSAISDSIPALGWVIVQTTPAAWVDAMHNYGQFYTNCVCEEWKNIDQNHVKWCAAWGQTLCDLRDYIRKHHTTGLVWAKSGTAPTPLMPIGDVCPAGNVGDDRSPLFASDMGSQLPHSPIEEQPEYRLFLQGTCNSADCKLEAYLVYTDGKRVPLKIHPFDMNMEDLKAKRPIDGGKAGFLERPTESDSEHSEVSSASTIIAAAPHSDMQSGSLVVNEGQKKYRLRKKRSSRRDSATSASSSGVVVTEGDKQKQQRCSSWLDSATSASSSIVVVTEGDKNKRQRCSSRRDSATSASSSDVVVTEGDKNKRQRCSSRRDSATSASSSDVVVTEGDKNKRQRCSSRRDSATSASSSDVVVTEGDKQKQRRCSSRRKSFANGRNGTTGNGVRRNKNAPWYMYKARSYPNHPAIRNKPYKGLTWECSKRDRWIASYKSEDKKNKSSRVDLYHLRSVNKKRDVKPGACLSLRCGFHYRYLGYCRAKLRFLRGRLTMIGEHNHDP